MNNNLKKHRKAAKLSLQFLADMYGGSKSHLWALEKGETTPTLSTAYAISKVLGVYVTDIWPDETEVEEELITVRRIVVNNA